MANEEAGKLCVMILLILNRHPLRAGSEQWMADGGYPDYDEIDMYQEKLR